MICDLSFCDLDRMHRVINDSAQAYKGVIPDDRWKEPYMPKEELKKEISAGVQFVGWMENGSLLGLMGIQPVKNVTLIRHSYVHSKHQRRGIGGKLLKHLINHAETTHIYVGTWEAATWAIRFYEKYEFKLTSYKEKERLLRKYWDIPERQIETSIVLQIKK